jgi:hypothetical protein
LEDFGGKGWFMVGVDVWVRFMSLVVEIGDEFVGFWVRLMRIGFWWIMGLGGWKLFLMDLFCLGWCLELFGERIEWIGGVLRKIWRFEGGWLWRFREKFKRWKRFVVWEWGGWKKIFEVIGK